MNHRFDSTLGSRYRRVLSAMVFFYSQHYVNSDRGRPGVQASLFFFLTSPFLHSSPWFQWVAILIEVLLQISSCLQDTGANREAVKR